MRNQRISLRFTATVVAVCITVGQPLAYADWASDWLSNKSISAPGKLSGQSRDYVTGGSFNARWPSDTWHPISGQLPHINAGCGGIDFFGGNVALLSPALLVKKLENILQNSAGVAFDLALAILSPQLSNIMKSMEAMSAALNSMSMNSCQAAKGMVVAAASGVDSILGSGQDIQPATWQAAGLGSTYTQWMQQGPVPSMFGITMPQMMSGNQTNPNTNPNLTGCTDPILTKLFTGDDSNYNPTISVMSVVGTSVTGWPDNYITLMRGLVGDVLITGLGQGNQSFYRAGCGANTATMSLQDMLAGNVAGQDSSGVCSPDTSGVTLNQYVTNMMQSISTKLAAGTSAQTLTTEEYNFVDTLPLGVLYMLRTGVASGQSAGMISDVSKLVAAEWLELSLKDIMMRVTTIQRTLKESMPNMTNNFATATGPGVGCNLSAQVPSFKEAVNTFSKRTQEVLAELDKNIQTEVGALNNLQQYTNNVQALNDRIKNYVKTQYGPAVGARITKTL